MASREHTVLLAVSVVSLIAVLFSYGGTDDLSSADSSTLTFSVSPSSSGFSSEADIVVVGSHSLSRTPEILNRLSALGKPRTAKDKLLEAVTQDLTHAGIGDELARQAGRLLLSESRLLSDSLPLERGTGKFYAIPTAARWLCHAVRTSRGYTSYGCDANLVDGVTVNIDRDTDDPPATYIFGFLADDIAAVAVITANGSHRAALATNAYFLVLHEQIEFGDIRALGLTLTSGERRTVPLEL